jgi:hypothetical protein
LRLLVGCGARVVGQRWYYIQECNGSSGCLDLNVFNTSEMESEERIVPFDICILTMDIRHTMATHITPCTKCVSSRLLQIKASIPHLVPQHPSHLILSNTPFLQTSFCSLDKNKRIVLSCKTVYTRTFALTCANACGYTPCLRVCYAVLVLLRGGLH